MSDVQIDWLAEGSAPHLHSMLMHRCNCDRHHDDSGGLWDLLNYETLRMSPLMA